MVRIGFNMFDFRNSDLNWTGNRTGNVSPESDDFLHLNLGQHLLQKNEAAASVAALLCFPSYSLLRIISNSHPRHPLRLLLLYFIIVHWNTKCVSKPVGVLRAFELLQRTRLYSSLTCFSSTAGSRAPFFDSSIFE
ncbi:hypothetical protein SAY86_005543 [Trapa natans]|uniref:Uncharacterized protein n=1 Tax=Trapa natans TaxID=22666 RepID=A0AAN7QUW7_TRANT|nr:hypothetical protein SAY86_005543 [Trapa natans]